MGCAISSPNFSQYGGQLQYGFEPGATSSFGVLASTRTDGNCGGITQGVVTPHLSWVPANQVPTSVVCEPFTLTGGLQPLYCNVANSQLYGSVTIQFSATDPANGATTSVALNPYAFRVFTGNPATVTSTHTSTIITTVINEPTTVTQVVATVTVAPTTCDGAPAPPADTLKVRRGRAQYDSPKYRRQVGGCNDNLGRMMKRNQGFFTGFCATYTLSSATPGQAYPSTLSAYTTAPARISSACSCAFVDATTTTSSTTSTTTTTPAVTPAPTFAPLAPGCSADNVLRALRGNNQDASAFCATYTLSSATPGQAYPPYIASYSTTSARISSACTCFGGGSPNAPATTTTTPSGPRVPSGYAGPDATYTTNSDGETLSLTYSSTASTYTFTVTTEYVTATETGSTCPVETVTEQ